MVDCGRLEMPIASFSKRQQNQQNSHNFKEITIFSTSVFFRNFPPFSVKDVKKMLKNYSLKIIESNGHEYA